MFSPRSALHIAAIVAAGLLSVASSRAGVISYPDYASWSAAVTGATTVTIPEPASSDPGYNPGGYDYFGNGDASVTYSGVVFSTSSALSNGDFFNVGAAFSGYPAVLSSQLQSVGVANILITLPGDATGFALNYGTFYGAGVTFLLSNGDQVVQSSLGSYYAVPDFFGVTDSTPFDTVLVTSPDEVLNLNNVSYGATGSVPEPAAWLLLSTGLAALLARGRRRSRHA
jgi:hypothetical protein